MKFSFKNITCCLSCCIISVAGVLSSLSFEVFAGGISSDPGDVPKNMAYTVDVDMNFYFSTHKRLNYKVQICNSGQNELKSVTVRTLIEGSVTDKSFTINPPLKTGETTVLTVNNIMNVEGLHTLSSAVCKANGVPISDFEYVSTEYGSYDYGYPRTVVVEDLSSALCGWCPKGIVSMDFFKLRFPHWICISVHDKDPMESETYSHMAQLLWGGLHSHKAWVNRSLEMDMIGEDPDDVFYDDFNQSFVASPAFVAIFMDAECDETSENVIVRTVTEMACEGKTPLALAFAVVEDRIGPFDQKNSYAGNQEITMGGWEKLSESESVMFDNVARRLEGFPGIEDSLPASFEAFVPYEFEHAISLEGVVNDVFKVIGMVVNTVTGEIMNAEQVLVSKSGVDNTSGDSGNDVLKVENGRIYSSDSDMQVFSLDGRKVDNINLQRGVYIVAYNSKIKKIFVK